MTLSKLAQLANVSVSTVSKAFSGKGDISDAMRDHIFAVAKAHGCFQQFYHMPYDRPVVAVIIPEAISHTYVRYMEALRRELEENGFTMLLSISNFDEQMKEQLVHYYLEHGKVDGLVLADGTTTLPPHCRTAVITLGGQKELPVSVNSPLDAGLDECLRQIYALGHRRLAYVGEPLIERKRHLLEEKMKILGLSVNPHHMICSNHRFEEAGRDGVRRIWEDPAAEKPTVILCGYSYIAVGALQELTENGISVPEQVSVIALNEDDLDKLSDRKIARISYNLELKCHWGIQLLKERMRTEQPNQACHVEIPTTFLPMDTLGKAPTDKK